MTTLAKNYSREPVDDITPYESQPIRWFGSLLWDYTYGADDATEEAPELWNQPAIDAYYGFPVLKED